jgi:23S rRNA (cytidine2498-2'-O)-methyltransferase
MPRKPPPVKRTTKPRRRTRPWAFLTRAGFEKELLVELGDQVNPQIAGPGIVVAAARPRQDAQWGALAFAHQAMETDGKPIDAHPELIADVLFKEITAIYPRKRPVPWTIQVVCPDSKESQDPRRPVARAIDEVIAEALDARLPREIADAYVDDPVDAERLAQVWIVDPETVAVGFTHTHEALSRFPGGRPPQKTKEEAPAKSAVKLEEAFEWLNLEPGRSETVVDLGAAPGGWTSVLLRHKARVIAVDRQALKIELPKKKAVYVQGNAFQFSPPETVDWVFADLAQRPMDVAKLLAKWGRHVWARQMVVSFKLPTKDRAETLHQLIEVIQSGGWKGVQARQLYHDKNEVTVFAWLDPKIAIQGRQASFDEMKRDRDSNPKPKGRRRRR